MRHDTNCYCTLAARSPLATHLLQNAIQQDSALDVCMRIDQEDVYSIAEAADPHCSQQRKKGLAYLSVPVESVNVSLYVIYHYSRHVAGRGWGGERRKCCLDLELHSELVWKTVFKTQFGMLDTRLEIYVHGIPRLVTESVCQLPYSLDGSL